MIYDYLIVGAGLFGATCARLLTDAGKTVLVIEKRDHVAGNCYDDIINGIPICRYGGHIFHTNSRRIWDFVNRFSVWRFYEHRVKASYQGKIYSFPPNLATFDQIGITPGPEGERQIRRMFFEGYTAKQWGRPYDQVPTSITSRVPIRYTYDDRYFSDRYQGVPEDGYTSLIANMLSGIRIDFGIDYLLDQDYWRGYARTVIYSGALDELFGCDLGRLEYRSLEWKHQIIDTPDYQGCATVNYTDAAVPYTRILEWQHYGWRSNGRNDYTIISVEYPRAAGEPYYPVGDDANLKLYSEYKSRLSEMPWLRVGGRLGSYRYYNMDQVIAQAFALVSEEAANDGG